MLRWFRHIERDLRMVYTQHTCLEELIGGVPEVNFKKGGNKKHLKSKSMHENKYGFE